MRLTQITEYCYQLPKYGFVNCYFVREEQTLTLIDAVLPNCHNAILAAADALHLPLSRILLTHAHEDHIGSVDALMKKQPALELVTSERSLPLLHKPAERSLRSDEPNGPNEDKIKGPLPGILSTPTRLVDHGDKVGPLRVIATPCHIPGHLSFLDERDGTLYAGDSLLTLSRLAVCTDSPWYFPAKYFAWSRPTAIKSATRLLDYPIQRFACGHGKVRPGGSLELQVAIERAQR